MKYENIELKLSKEKKDKYYNACIKMIEYKKSNDLTIGDLFESVNITDILDCDYSIEDLKSIYNILDVYFWESVTHTSVYVSFDDNVMKTINEVYYEVVDMLNIYYGNC